MPTNEELQSQIEQLEANIVALTIQLNPLPDPPKPPGRIYSDFTSYSVFVRQNGKTASMSAIEKGSLIHAREEATGLSKRYKKPVRFVPWDQDFKTYSNLPGDCILVVEQRFIQRGGESSMNSQFPIHSCEAPNPHGLARTHS